ncbi:bifunctional phosphopantothenoylcysteine decarboxylase/phosphopantothenate--cysteine ligase CoaBC [Heliorestis acidaminivorans]|uniref:Coenzyme A biosynthesis bifunctional protein CoaBC n=1 Tax=Heliorestis acidaminivorans TaxID=553427 RepID=A0A6I0F0J8_9FIRM|nr:bifunctional phosphopantothenoylcysteine decarboxylase/phosphopantothenate--cysteine ligase CoaBC [Heliorestis acidaminivorans]KAB2954476.1 bifunctional phosphopantothenoylcysteine decarboxylase/phosphopantothenate--cysteine ligase CoaBC [Heliorestis acidaminivorans]
MNSHCLQGKRIVVAVTGGIAAYKACDLVSRLIKLGSDVQVIMTAGATKFVTPLTFQTLSRNRVITEMFEEPKEWNVAHVSVAEAADLFVVAPATANLIGKLRAGIADDFLTTSLLATKAPLLLAPAMNVNMYDHPAVQENMEVLRRRGIMILDPAEGLLACGVVGKGRLAEVDQILDRIMEIMSHSQALAGKEILITAGGTREPIDPVRYLTNRSSGKMGYALAEEAVALGASVTLISAPTALPAPRQVNAIYVESAKEMRSAVLERYNKVDVVIKAAAVADYRPLKEYDRKIKKKDDRFILELVKNPDILAELGQNKKDQILVGFAAETDELEKYAQEKVRSKNLDLLVANDVTIPGAGFAVDTNIVTLFDKDGQAEPLAIMSKKEVARRILLKIKELLSQR